MKNLTVTNSANYEFNVVIIEQGQKYGLHDCLIHKEVTPLVEFYANNTSQFISRYYADTLLEGSNGLCLDGYNSNIWSIDHVTMQYIRQWISANI